jgi:hypothetical protein
VTPPSAPRNPNAGAPKVEPPKASPVNTDRKIALMGSGEQNFYRQVLQDVDPKSPNYNQALEDLNAWAHNYPYSASQNDRRYFLVHAYSSLGRTDRVLESAAPLIEAGVQASFSDEQQILQVLVDTCSSLLKISAPTAKQTAIGEKAAKQLLDFLPVYFTLRLKPANVSDLAWRTARDQLSAVARQALVRLANVKVAAN